MVSYKSVEKLLSNYNMYKANAKIKAEEIKNLLENDGLGAMKYEGVNANTNSINDTVGEVATNNIIDTEKLEEEKLRLEEKVRTLDILLESLNEVEREVITLRYIKGRQWYEIAYKVQYSERQCRRIKNIAIEKIKRGLNN